MCDSGDDTGEVCSLTVSNTSNNSQLTEFTSLSLRYPNHHDLNHNQLQTIIPSSNSSQQPEASLRFASAESDLFRRLLSYKLSKLSRASTVSPPQQSSSKQSMSIGRYSYTKVSQNDDVEDLDDIQDDDDCLEKVLFSFSYSQPRSLCTP